MTNTETGAHVGPVLDRKGDFEVIDCEACGYKHVLPMPTEAELGALYDEDYYANEKPLYLEQYRQDLAWWNVVYAERLELLEDGANDARRLLDIGSGPGFFLALAKQRGWETLGIEPSAQAAAHSRELGLEIVEEFLDEASSARLGTFDAIHLCNVLEHVPNPAQLLALAGRMLRPGGRLLVVVPNDYNPLQDALRKSGHAPWWIAPPHHLNYFDPPSLRRVLEREGFGVLASEGTFPMELFLLMGDEYVGNDELGRACHAKRMRLEETLASTGAGDLKRALYRALADLNLGREIQILATRV